MMKSIRKSMGKRQTSRKIGEESKQAYDERKSCEPWTTCPHRQLSAASGKGEGETEKPGTGQVRAGSHRGWAVLYTQKRDQRVSAPQTQDATRAPDMCPLPALTSASLALSCSTVIPKRLKPRQRQPQCHQGNEGLWARGPGLTVDLGTASLTLHLFPLLPRETTVTLIWPWQCQWASRSAAFTGPRHAKVSQHMPHSWGTHARSPHCNQRFLPGNSISLSNARLHGGS